MKKRSRATRDQANVGDTGDTVVQDMKSDATTTIINDTSSSPTATKQAHIEPSLTTSTTTSTSYYQRILMDMRQAGGELNYHTMVTALCDPNLQPYTVDNFIRSLQFDGAQYHMAMPPHSHLNFDYITSGDHADHAIIKIITRDKLFVESKPYFACLEPVVHTPCVPTTPLQISLDKLFSIILNRQDIFGIDVTDPKSSAPWFIVQTFLEHETANYLLPKVLQIAQRSFRWLCDTPQRAPLPFAIRRHRNEVVAEVISGMGTNQLSVTTVASSFLTAIVCNNFEAVALLAWRVILTLHDIEDEPITKLSTDGSIWYDGVKIHTANSELDKFFVEPLPHLTNVSAAWRRMIKPASAMNVCFDLISRRQKLGHKALSAKCLLDHLHEISDLFVLIYSYIR